MDEEGGGGSRVREMMMDHGGHETIYGINMERGV